MGPKLQIRKVFPKTNKKLTITILKQVIICGAAGAHTKFFILLGFSF